MAAGRQMQSRDQEKRAARVADLLAIHSGRKSVDQVRRENSLFANAGRVVIKLGGRKRAR